MASYLDSSVLVKRYVREPGSREAHRLFEKDEPLFVSAIAWAECLAAISKKRREGGLSARNQARASEAFVAEWRHLHEIAVAGEVQVVILELLGRTPLRGMDAIHLASALWVERRLESPLSFYCSDGRLARAARVLGLAVVDPVEVEA